jgi:hypothetical protein
MRFRLLLLLVCALVRPQLAHAWTDAHVRDALARVELDLPAQRVQVTLDLAVEVRGGWLERLDLAGLEEGLVPDPTQPAWALLEGGELLPAKLVVRDAVLSLRFQRRDGLRRGTHHVVLRYSAPLTRGGLHDERPGRIRWTLPGWESGLGSAVIELIGVRGMRAVTDADVAQQIESSAEGARFTRQLVPRASPWTVAVDVPLAALEPVQQAGKLSGASKTESAGRYATGGWLALALALLTAARRYLPRRAPAPALRELVWGSGLAALGALCWVFVPPLALVCWALLSWYGAWRAWLPRASEAALPFGRVVALQGAELSRLARRVWWQRLGTPWGEPGSLLGCVGCAALVGLVVSAPGALDLAGNGWGLGALCALFGAISSSRFWQPRETAEQVLLLLRAARRARLVACGLSLNAYSADGVLLQPRLRLTPGARYPGLLQLEVRVDSRRDSPALWLSAVVEADSAAERWLRALWPTLEVERSAGGQRLALLRPIADVGQAAEELLECLSRESQKCWSIPPASTQAA